MKNLIPKWRGRGAALLLAATTLAVHAAADVTTLGGGPNQTSPAKTGATDGDTFAYAKFRNPNALAVDTNGNLLIADQGNNKVRKVSKPGQGDSLTSTFAAQLPAPISIAVDRSNVVHVLTYRDGKIRKFSGNGALLGEMSGFRKPTALALHTNGVAYVAELGGNIYRVNVGGVIELIATGFRKPRGLAVLGNGLVAVTESTGHAVQLLDPVSGTSTRIAGGNPKGLLDGPGSTAQFNSPQGIAVSPNGALVVADRLNHRLRVIDTNHVVTSLYGVPKMNWVRPFAGWLDGTGGQDGTAAARTPVGVAVSSGGTVYVTEIFWGLIRQVAGAGLGGTNSSGSITNGGGGGGGGNNTNLLAAPTFAPNAGYFPFGATITVTSAAPVYYTTDGTEPTTNSASVTLSNSVGSFRFTENLKDLTALRLKAISASGASTVVSGQPAPANQFGIPRDFIAGSGARILVPIVANLRADVHVKSYQYRVEITPEDGAPAIEPYVSGVALTTNDFVPIITPAAAGQTARYTVSAPYFAGNTIGVVVTAFGTNASIDIQDFATTALLMVPVSGSALEGDRYRIQVLQVTATSDGYQERVPVSAGPARTITVQGLPYLVGDVAVGSGYNAGEFGDGDLQNNDVNAVMFASFGVRVPYAFSDAFNAMDVHPTEPRFQGNLLINFFDWQVVLARSLRLNSTNVTRVWNAGLRQSDLVPLAPTPSAAAPAKYAPTKSAPATGWSREVKLSAGNSFNQPYGVCEVPVNISVASGLSVAGLGFRVSVEAESGLAAATGVSFEPNLGADGFISARGSSASDLVCAWSLVPSSAFSPLVQSNQTLGTLRFTVPQNQPPGKHYTVRFHHASGGPDLDTELTFESIPGSAWVYWTPTEGGQKTSDEWRVNYFGSVSAASAADSADPDGDGQLNWQEYQNGTNPTQP